MMKNVQISQELFVALLHYHLSGENEYEEVIEQGLEQKLDAMLRHELYAQYKTAPTEEQREQARQEYLDRRGVPESFRCRKVVLDRAAARYSETPSADGSPRQGAKASFDGRNVCQKCFCVTFDESNKAFAVSGTSYFHRERTCD